MSIIVNNKEYEIVENKTLLRFLRDDLGLKSVKDGCSEGACGTCHVLVNGTAIKACSPRLKNLDGANVLTIEGFDEFERELYVRAFGEAGAVQCGFCIPGMVISAKGLIDKVPDPTEDEIRHAIRNNICRCTGYKKIVEGIKLAARYKREGILPDVKYSWKIGESVPRLDVRAKVLGEGKYADDIEVEGMIYGGAVRLPVGRARIISIDASKALALDGVIGVYTADDIPGENKVGHIFQDWDTMIAVGDNTRCIGDAVALVAARTPQILEKARKLVKVEYETLPTVNSPYEAMKEDAPLLHEGGNLLTHKHVSRGDALGAIARSSHVLTREFHTHATEHAFLEPECAVAVPKADNVIHIYTSDQGVFPVRHETGMVLGIPEENIKIENALVGGAFGGKEDVSVQHHAALITYLTGMPCKVKLSRQESIDFHPKRHPMDMKFTVGVDDEGIIQGAKVEVIADTGAYASLGAAVLERACTHSSGPYNYQNFEVDGWAYYTNNPPAGAFRGFGVTQTCFGMESMLDLLAEEVGISPWEIRYRNAIRPGQELPNGQIVDGSAGLAETLEAVKAEFDANPGAGIACCMKNAGVGVGLPDYGRVILAVVDGKVHIRAGASCLGQGLGTVLTQLTVEYSGLDRSYIEYDAANTYNAKDSGMSSGSRQTTVTGEACIRAARLLKEALVDSGLDKLEGREFYGEYFARTDKLGADVPNPVSHVAYGYATQLCILNEDGTIRKIVAAHDVGKAINPLSLEGQIEGGVVMGMGFTLTEDFIVRDGIPQVKFGTLGLNKADTVPEIQSIIIEKEGLETSAGAIGIGEITTIPTAPAIAAAYYYKDGELRTELPLVNTPYSKKTKKSE